MVAECHSGSVLYWRPCNRLAGAAKSSKRAAGVRNTCSGGVDDRLTGATSPFRPTGGTPAIPPQQFPSFLARRGFYAAGRGGQRLYVVPKYDLVIAHLVDTTGGKRVANRDVERLYRMILAAYQPGTAKSS
jgi:CubicO group peptidase (beta-lactamase class C family)